MNRNIKLISAANETEALELACGHFSCESDEVFLKVLDEAVSVGIEADGSGAQILYYAAFIGQGGVRAAYIDADFNLFFDSDGVYLEVYPVIGGGRPQEPSEVTGYIVRKELSALNAEAVNEQLQAGFGRVQIAPQQEETLLSEDITAWCSKDEMEGYMKFLPPDEGGARLTVNQISEKLKQAGIVFGVSPLSLGEANREKAYGKQYTVARGQLAENGENGTLVYHFDTSKDPGRPAEDEAGRVDYRDLNMFVRVKKGQLLITRTLATPGKSGSTVTGRELVPRAGKEVNMPRTKNILVNEEKTTAHAEVSGLVETVNGALCVSNTYTIKDDCDLSTGNIDFDGNVVIGGAVISGMTIRAKGDITIGGVVNEAELIAEGNIELKRGIQGNDKGKITAGGNIVASFIERADVRAHGDITSDVIMHSNIEAGRDLHVSGKRGNIVGGKALVAGEIIAKTIGAPSHVMTDVEVGLMPEKKARIKYLREELERYAKEDAKIQQIELYLSRADNVPEEKRAALTENVTITRAQNDKTIASYKSELAELEYEAEHATDGRVHCSVVVYPGSRITIGTGMYRVDEQTQAATFKYVDGEIVFVACERRE